MAALVAILGAVETFPSWKNISNIVFVDMFGNNPKGATSLIDILAKPVSGTIAIVGIILLYIRTRASDRQVQIAEKNLRRAELEKIEEDFREAVKDLASKDTNTILMAIITIKQIVANHPENFLEITYSILIETIHSSFNSMQKNTTVFNTISQSVKKEMDFDRIMSDMKKRKVEIEYFENVSPETEQELNQLMRDIPDLKKLLKWNVFQQINKDDIDISDIFRFQNSFTAIANIRNSNKIMKFERKLNVSHLLKLDGINYFKFDDNLLDIFGDFKIRNGSFENFSFNECGFSSITFSNVNFCHISFRTDVTPMYPERPAQFVKCMFMYVPNSEQARSEQRAFFQASNLIKPAIWVREDFKYEFNQINALFWHHQSLNLRYHNDWVNIRSAPADFEFHNIWEL